MKEEFEKGFDSLDIDSVSPEQESFLIAYQQSDDKEKYLQTNLAQAKKLFPVFAASMPQDKPKETAKPYTEENLKAAAWTFDEESPNYYGNWSIEELNNRAANAYPDMDLTQARGKFLSELSKQKIDYDREKLRQQELHPSFRKHPLEWAKAQVGKIAFPELYHAAEQGEGPTTWGEYLTSPMAYKDFGMQAANIVMPGSRIAGRFVPAIGRNVLGRIGASVAESGAQEAVREGLSDYEAINPAEIIGAGLTGGVGSAATWKGAGDILKRVDTKATKKAGNVLEDIGLRKDELAKDYVAQAEKQIADKKVSFDPLGNQPLTKQVLIGPTTDILRPQEVKPLHDLIAEISKGKLTIDELMEKYPIHKLSSGKITMGFDGKGLQNITNPYEYVDAIKDMMSRHGPIKEGFESITTKYAPSKAFAVKPEAGVKSGLKKGAQSATAAAPRYGYRAKIQPDEEDIIVQAETIARNNPEEYEKWKNGFANNFTPEQKRVLEKASMFKLGW